MSPSQTVVLSEQSLDSQDEAAEGLLRAIVNGCQRPPNDSVRNNGLEVGLDCAARGNASA